MISPPYSNLHITKKFGGQAHTRREAANIMLDTRLLFVRANTLAYQQVKRIEEYLRATVND